MNQPLETLLGRLAVERRLLTPDQVDAALRDQERELPPPPLGVLLVERGLLTPAQVEELLDAQAALLARYDAEGRETARAWRFGRFAVARRAVSVEEVNRALREQGRRRDAGEPAAPLGRILVDHGALTEAALEELVRATGAPSAPSPSPAAAGEELAPRSAPQGAKGGRGEGRSEPPSPPALAPASSPSPTAAGEGWGEGRSAPPASPALAAPPPAEPGGTIRLDPPSAASRWLGPDSRAPAHGEGSATDTATLLVPAGAGSAVPSAPPPPSPAGRPTFAP
ncbi:MAG: hypothetical protein HZA54_01015, partial [Planctomycetes bacterium]|nr:hypothetical protein [Planctomycetota bacterium]